METRIRIDVPASSANLGPGFDALALAVDLRNTFEMEPVDDGTIKIVPSNETDPRLTELSQRMAEDCARLFFERTGVAERGFFVSMVNRIPIARGLGSSATLRLAILEGLNQLFRSDITQNTIVAWASELEGCADNATACYFGGFTASGFVNGRLVKYRVAISDEIHFVAVSPVGAVETNAARAVFADQVPRKDAVFNLNRAVLLSMAFAAGDYDAIGDLMEDRLHQPQRQAAIPALAALSEAIAAAREAGALGAYLSGSGSTIMAIARSGEENIALAIQGALTRKGISSEARYLKADNEGLRWALVS